MKTQTTGSHRLYKAAKAGHVYCPDRKAEIPESECLECPKFRVWHKIDGIIRRCYYEYKDLKARGYYFRTSVSRHRMKTPQPRGGGKRLGLSGTGISGECHTARNTEAKEMAEQDPVEYRQPDEPELEKKRKESRKKPKHPNPEQEPEIENEWLDLLNDIKPPAPMETQDTLNGLSDETDPDQNLQNPLSPPGTVDPGLGPVY